MVSTHTVEVCVCVSPCLCVSVTHLFLACSTFSFLVSLIMYISVVHSLYIPCTWQKSLQRFFSFFDNLIYFSTLCRSCCVVSNLALWKYFRKYFVTCSIFPPAVCVYLCVLSIFAYEYTLFSFPPQEKYLFVQLCKCIPHSYVFVVSRTYLNFSLLKSFFLTSSFPLCGCWHFVRMDLS